eukprot:TRINITY_DN1880_c0_g1_i16.p1 TRINITY_DN1880_c0_g1~~TRINITY_DN1880_c0_g1_i16.p1  ORF type:complete len:471 (-),score=112.50 TRINITY_DN1880_c0_g1_i16:68-1426(-)
MEERDWECWAQVVPWLRVEELVRLGKTCRLAHSLCAERATTIRAPSLGHITFYSYLSATTRKEKKSHHNTQKKGHHMETELERLQALIGTQQQGLVRLQALIGTQQQGVARQLALIDTQQQGLVRRQQELESQRALIAKLRVLSDTQQQALIDMQQQQEPNTQRAQIEQMDSALAEVAGIATQLLEVALRACDAAPRQIPETLENMLPKEVFAVVMFINIVGYTELTRLCTAEQAFTVCKRLAETSDSAVCAAGGLLFPHQLESKLVKIKDIGDCQLLCVFDGSGAAQKVVQVCFALLQRFQHPPLHVGIAAGPVFVGRSGSDRRIDIFGRTVNLASRLEGVAPSGKVAVDTECVKLLTGSPYFVSPAREALLKGLGRIPFHIVSETPPSPTAIAKIRAMLFKPAAQLAASATSPSTAVSPAPVAAAAVSPAPAVATTSPAPASATSAPTPT